MPYSIQDLRRPQPTSSSRCGGPERSTGREWALGPCPGDTCADMLTLDIPGRGTLALERLVLDVNGTIAEDGHLIPGVKERLNRIARSLEVVMVTADTHGRQMAIDG